ITSGLLTIHHASWSRLVAPVALCEPLTRVEKGLDIRGETLDRGDADAALNNSASSNGCSALLASAWSPDRMSRQSREPPRRPPGSQVRRYCFLPGGTTTHTAAQTADRTPGDPRDLPEDQRWLRAPGWCLAYR